MSPLPPSYHSPSSAAQSYLVDASMTPSSSYQSAEYSRAYSVDASEPLKPIREEKSQESLDNKDANSSIDDSKDDNELMISNDISTREDRSSV